ncbi:MAG: hypothetical protein QXE27_06060 [Thermoplasmata archaeon]
MNGMNIWKQSKVYVVTVGEQNLLNEITKSTRKLLNELEIHITQKLGS